MTTAPVYVLTNQSVSNKFPCVLSQKMVDNLNDHAFIASDFSKYVPESQLEDERKKNSELEESLRKELTSLRKQVETLLRSDTGEVLHNTQCELSALKIKYVPASQLEEERKKNSELEESLGAALKDLRHQVETLKKLREEDGEALHNTQSELETLKQEYDKLEGCVCEITEKRVWAETHNSLLQSGKEKLVTENLKLVAENAALKKQLKELFAVGVVVRVYSATNPESYYTGIITKTVDEKLTIHSGWFIDDVDLTRLRRIDDGEEKESFLKGYYLQIEQKLSKCLENVPKDNKKTLMQRYLNKIDDK